MSHTTNNGINQVGTVKSPVKATNGVTRIHASPPVYIKDSETGLSKDSFCIPEHFSSCIESVLIPGGVIRDRTERMACDIASDIGHDSFTALCVLKGGYQFFSDLLQMIRQTYRVSSSYSENGRQQARTLSPFHIRTEFIRVKSYEDDSSTGKVTITGMESLESLRGTNVLIVEDIIDSGLTMVKLLDALKEFEPKSVRVASLFVKRNPRSIGYVPHYIGFDIPDKFIIGYNLDYNDYFRELNHVCVISDEAKERFSHKKSQ